MFELKSKMTQTDSGVVFRFTLYHCGKSTRNYHEVAYAGHHTGTQLLECIDAAERSACLAFDQIVQELIGQDQRSMTALTALNDVQKIKVSVCGRGFRLNFDSGFARPRAFPIRDTDELKIAIATILTLVLDQRDPATRIIYTAALSQRLHQLLGSRMLGANRAINEACGA